MPSNVRTRLESVRTAIDEVLKYGKSTAHGDRSVTRADIPDLIALEKYLAGQADIEEGAADMSNRIGRSKIRYFEPI
jgi:hypothetical protein